MATTSKDKILFLDIETVSQAKDYHDLPERLVPLWEKKSTSLQQRMPETYPEDMHTQAIFEKSAAIFAEFGKIICISVGFIYYKNGEEKFRVKSFYGDDEKNILIEFAATLTHFGNASEINLCGHNIKEFDIPYICRRMLINNLSLPEILNIGAKKPWEVPLLDTLEMWKFGDFKHYTSLNLLTALFDIPTPKDDIDGSQVSSVYYGEHNIKRIATYCEKDVVATAQLFLRLNQMPVIQDHCIEHV
ncbi:3'-5' exonuclease [Microbacter margulisiae]|uniref:Predicted 3'-5' exonuclease PolB-like domain-containing protein n=1 Tax=Microbacter margulisiae TaxID=1350067 RepID=A0A7W5H214_9PORP|nr:3'-5' exonuclease [Microbacter margulisiae]MBB3187265.1 hypothetical protein [Microbacter margulisiae]